MSIITEIESELKKIIKKAFPGVKAPDFRVEVSRRPEMCEYAANIHFLLSKILKKKPQEIASKIGEKFAKKIGSVEGEGVFLNIKLSDEFLEKSLQEVLQKQELFFNSNLLKNKKINVEFISANPTGPLTLGNGRGGFSGDTLSRVFESAGAKVTREYYLNDVGRQVEKLAESAAYRYLELLGKKIDFPEYCYQGNYIVELAREILVEHGDEYKDMAVLEIGSRIQEFAYQRMLASIKGSVLKMGINFDNWFSEKSLYESGQVESALAKLSQLGLLYEADGALWFKATQFGDDKDRVVKKTDEAYTYFASDIAYFINKLDARGFDLALTFLGADHAGYVPRLLASLKPFGLDKKVKFPVFQLVRLFSKGKEVKISKRQGTFVTIDELLDDIPLDVARYFFLTKAMETHLDFNLDLAKEESKKNPVYYIQYAYARISSLKKEAEKAGLNLKITAISLDSAEERNLAIEILRLSEIIESVAESYALQTLPEYALKLADKFHYFYEKKRVIGEKANIASSRLALIEAARIALNKILGIMGITSPERM